MFIEKILKQKNKFSTKKTVFLINDCCFPQQILVLPLAFSGQKITGHDASLQDTGERDYCLGSSCFCDSHTVPACVLYVWAV